MKPPNRTLDKRGGVLWRAAPRSEKRKQINLRTRANEDEEWDGLAGGEARGGGGGLVKLQLSTAGLGRRAILGWFQLDARTHARTHRFEWPLLNSCSSVMPIRRNPGPSPDGCLKNPISWSECTVCQHLQCTQQWACIFPCTSFFFWQGVKSRSPDPGCDSV